MLVAHLVMSYSDLSSRIQVLMNYMSNEISCYNDELASSEIYGTQTKRTSDLKRG